jgi:hypothetical protein
MFALTQLGLATSATLVAIACVDVHRQPTIGQLTLSGFVSETTSQGSRPVQGAAIDAWVQEARVGYSYWEAHGPTRTNSVGFFHLTRLANDTTVQLRVYKRGYVQQCALPRVTMDSDMQLNAQIVSTAQRSSTPEAIAPPAPGFRSISGVILDPGQRPLHGAFVDFEPIEDFPAAFTFSDASGRYLLCGIPDGEKVGVCAAFRDDFACVSVPPGKSTGVDITVPY